MRNLASFVFLFLTASLYSPVVLSSGIEFSEKKKTYYYIVNKDDPYGPVVISETMPSIQAGQKISIMRDIGESSPGLQSLNVSKVERRAPEPAPSAAGKQLKFKSLAVVGRTSNPRMEFKRPRLEGRRLDETRSLDFYEKVFSDRNEF